MSEERSQSPTPQRRRLARERGQVAKSHELVAALGFVAAVGATMFLGPKLLQNLTDLFRNQLQSASGTLGDTAQSAESIQLIGFQVIAQLLPILGIVCGIVLVTHLAQTGFLWLPQKMVPDLSHVDPVRGLQRLAPTRQLGRLLFQSGKVALIVVVAGTLMWQRMTDIIYLGASETAALLPNAWQLMSQIGLAIGVALILVGAIDYAFQRWQHEQRLRMTPDELREEVKAIRGLGYSRTGSKDKE